MELETHFDSITHRDWEEDVDGTIRFAMLGIGYWVREQVIPAVEASDYCETTVIISGSKDKAASVVDETPTARRGITYEEFHNGHASDAYDAVYVCTPNALHLEYVETAAEFDKAVLCEKPMEADVERAREIVDICNDADVPLMIGYRMHTEPAVRRMRDLIDDGFIGEPVTITGQMTQPLLDLIPDPNQWRLDPSMAGYGSSIMDIGLYPLNTSRFVLSSDPIAVQATTATVNEPFSDVDERATFQLEFPEGVLAACTASQNAAMSSHLRITGTDGELMLDPAFFPSQPRKLRLFRDGTFSSVDFEQANQMTEEFDYFANCILTGRELEPDGEHGLVDMQALQAIYEAAETDTRIEL